MRKPSWHTSVHLPVLIARYPPISMISLLEAFPKKSRVDSNKGHSSAIFGQVYWSPTRSFWMTFIYAGAILGGYQTFQWDALLLFVVTSLVTLCLGYSVGIHRRLIHNSFSCHQWLENILVYLGVLVGIGGPFSIIEKHDLRDWAQRQPNCHPYFNNRRNILIDWVWNLHCSIQLHYPPIFRHERRIADNEFYSLLERTWMIQQLPLALLFYAFGGWSWVFWGIYVRVAASTTGLWLAEHLTHAKINRQAGQSKQGRFSRRRATPKSSKYSTLLGLITFGECWQANHKAFPNAARFSLYPQQTDPSWWVISAFSRVGLVWDVQYSSNAVTLNANVPRAGSTGGQTAMPERSAPQSVARLSSLNN